MDISFSAGAKTPYRVLARQYRPQKLSELIGQETLVKTLAQGIERNRLPHAFLFHGTRGVGKTTTARILAKALNCIGQNGKGGPTPDPCGLCEECIAISADRHLDVVEMDAASRTGVDDVREVIEAARYKAVKGRYKIYIIDEVHMLSKSAFNALLKTLEEPPPHVKFIFATTEIRKIPETVLSRCMRFDLKRIAPKCLFDHFALILKQENVAVDEEALSLIVRAADGSARDGLSLLDQAIALSQDGLSVSTVRSMLGLADRGLVFILLQSLLKGQADKALSGVRDLYRQGADAVILMEDLLDLTYWLTCLKTAPQLQQDVTWPESDRRQGMEIISDITLPALMRVWQVLHKGYDEVSRSPVPFQAAEMVLVRVAYLKNLPQADDLLAFLQGMPREGGTPEVPAAGAVSPANLAQEVLREKAGDLGADLGADLSTPALSGDADTVKSRLPQGFPDMLDLLKCAREPLLYSHVLQDVHLVSYNPGSMVIRLASTAAKTLPAQLRQILERETAHPWVIEVTDKGGSPTLAQQEKAAHEAHCKVTQDNPVIQSLLENFPDATLTIK